MNFPLVAKNCLIYDSTDEMIASVEPGPFAQGIINAKDIVELANLGYRTRQHEAELRSLTELKGEASFVFSPSVMVEFTKEEFANFQTGLWALRHLAGRTETPKEKKVDPASWNPDAIAKGRNPGKLTNRQVGRGFRLLDIGEAQAECDEWWGWEQWNDQVIGDAGEVITDASIPHRRRIS